MYWRICSYVHGVRCLIPPSEVVLECCASRVPFWLVWHRERSRILVYDFVLLVDDDIENGSITIAVLWYGLWVVNVSRLPILEERQDLLTKYSLLTYSRIRFARIDNTRRPTAERSACIRWNGVETAANTVFTSIFRLWYYGIYLGKSGTITSPLYRPLGGISDTSKVQSRPMKEWIFGKQCTEFIWSCQIIRFTLLRIHSRSIVVPCRVHTMGILVLYY